MTNLERLANGTKYLNLLVAVSKSLALSNGISSMLFILITSRRFYYKNEIIMILDIENVLNKKNSEIFKR
jgi:hypothetical protein